VFASEGMSKQITMISPYHLNADYFYSRGFKRGLDDTIFRYADHDPILIHLQLGEEK
jgi:predicted extracellular nuclease